MPRRAILSENQRDTLLALPESQDDLIRHYTFNESDLALIRQRRSDANKLGFAIQLCILRYLGYALTNGMKVAESVVHWVAAQIKADVAVWLNYSKRDETRREHFQESRTYLGLSTFGLSDIRYLVHVLIECHADR